MSAHEAGCWCWSDPQKCHVHRPVMREKRVDVPTDERLRGLAAHIRDEARFFNWRETIDQAQADADACDLGARCVEIVLQLAALDYPWEDRGLDGDEQCFFCSMRRKVVEHPEGAHGPDCLYAQARTLVERLR